MRKISLLLSVLIFSIFLSSCSSLNPDQKEVDAMALQAYNEVKKQATISNNSEWKAILDRVATRLASKTGEDFEWEWILIENPETNAWCMPGGKIAVYTGLMQLLANEAELAAVLGHEVAHAAERHGKERYARAIRGNVAGLAIGAASVIGGQMFCKSKSCELLTGLGGAAAGFAITFFDMKFSRAEESEADKVGQDLMARAGYDPAAAVKVWERMAKASGSGEPPEILSTHPSSSTRINNLSKWLPEVRETYESAPRKYGLGETIE